MSSTPLSFRNAHLQDIADALDNGYLRLYSGTVPANADTALSGQTLLAELRFAAQSEVSVANGLITFDDLIPEDAGLADGVPTFARGLQSDGTTMVQQFTAGASGSGAEVEISTASVQTGAAVSVASATLAYPA